MGRPDHPESNLDDHLGDTQEFTPVWDETAQYGEEGADP